MKSCLVAFTLLTAACGPSDSEFTEFTSYKSPDGSFRVDIDSANSKLAFGPHTIRVYVIGSNGARNHIVTTKIANDGGRIDRSNVKANWVQPHIVRFCLSGAEQKDSVLEIDLRARSHKENEQDCS